MPEPIVDTPALVIDRPAFFANLKTMAQVARAHGIALRPHAKSHKSVAIAEVQIAAGALGQCCAKLGEVEVFAQAGIRGLLLCTPLRGQAKLRRLAAVLDVAPDTMVVVEDLAGVAALAEALAGLRLDVLIDVDVGTHRTGVASPEAALAIAEAIAAAPGLRLVGLQGYAGHIQATPAYAERRTASGSALGVLAEIRDLLVDQGHPCPIVTGGGTGTHDFDHLPGILTELQVGSYLFSDVVYDRVEMSEGGERRWQNSLFVWTSVLSAQHEGFATTDAGIKSFSTDGPPPVIASGAPRGSTYAMFGDEFGKVTLADPTARLAVGDLVTCIVPHCDPNVNLFDRYHVVEDGRVVEVWPIEARGKVA